MSNDSSLKFFRQRLPLFVGIIVIMGGIVAAVSVYHATAAKTTSQTTAPDYYAQIVADLSPSTTNNYVKNIQTSVPILMYHYIRSVPDAQDRLGYSLSVTPEHFDAQLKWLEDNRYTTYPLKEFCSGNIPREGKPIILTFDDGYEDAYTNALPILRTHHFTGTFFIVSGFVDTPEYLSSSQLKGLADAGMELGAHTVKHINLATASVTRQKEEIVNSRQSSPVLAYPAGKYSIDTIDLTKDSGYKCAVTTQNGIATYASPLYELPRVRISGSLTITDFIERIEGGK